MVQGMLTSQGPDLALLCPIKHREPKCVHHEILDSVQEEQEGSPTEGSHLLLAGQIHWRITKLRGKGQSPDGGFVLWLPSPHRKPVLSAEGERGPSFLLFLQRY